MFAALGHIVPISLAVAASSVPIMATLMILLAPGRTRTAFPFMCAWVLGMLAVVVVCLLCAQALPTTSRHDTPNPAIATAEMVIGAALVVLAAVSLIRRRGVATEAATPRWMSAVGRFDRRRVIALALLLELRPKNLLLAAAAAVAVRGASLDAEETTVAVLVFVVVGVSTVVVPIVVTLARPERVEPRLKSAQNWMLRNNAAVTAVILVVIGVFVFASGVSRW